MSEHLANLVGVVALDVVTRTTAAIEAATGLTIVEATALSALAVYAEGDSVESLQRAVDLSQPGTVRLVDRLVERGLVERRHARGDRRVTAVHLSSRGRRTVATIRRTRLAVIESWTSRLTEPQREALEPVLANWAIRDVEATSAGGLAAEYRCRLCDPDACGHPVGCPVTVAVMGDRP
ncbi:MAG: hypothetical protein DLM57_05480 [Pseudonocardiales bacterium]|nr:MAG: hypothetical protein DLM57_05480 [Pseudonocardiales bacterium]